ncbi:hippocampus abundant transcript 1a [Wuchereria bancrofti]|uniref:Hippocampus abundant transcript 1a n=1 Tax=Wuchereria bancrofti TaxID=6293 RepID=J9ERV7_WUCBA|nr:hippocampus abundant transcript 1a [Wuchereria bancrofti]
MVRGARIFDVLFSRKLRRSHDGSTMGCCEASVHHAVIVIFLEYFAWGLLTVPVINVLADTFPTNKFLMNGVILGIKGLLSFLSAPLLGAVSDKWGRKSFLLLTVFFTCMPIPCLKISPWLVVFCLFSISGLFSTTFSVVLAYVADITDKADRSTAYGLISATFAASLVTSPALGAWISESWGDDSVVLLATVIASLDVLFILLIVPESLSSRNRRVVDAFRWQRADPFATLRIVWEDRLVLHLAAIIFLRLVGILSVIAQTGILFLLTNTVGTKYTITLGLSFQFAQLLWYGLGTKYWMMWAAGLLVAMSQLIYPSISAFVSVHSDRDKQGTVQGVITGVRGLCQGLGPALFGFIFYLFDMDLNVDNDGTGHVGIPPFPAPRIRVQPIISPQTNPRTTIFFGSLMVLLALFVNSSLPKVPSVNTRFFRRPSTAHSRQSSDDSRLLQSS